MFPVSDSVFQWYDLGATFFWGMSGAMLAARASLAARRQPERYMDFHFALLGQEDAITEPMIFVEAQKAGMDLGKLKADMGGLVSHALAGVFFAVSVVFVLRSFYGMRIGTEVKGKAHA